MTFSKKTIITIFIAGIIVVLAVFINKLNSNLMEITEEEKCPACFGVSLCEAINNNQITFEYKDYYSFFNNIFSVKNVYYGKYKNKKVVMKKLAHKSELRSFDELICKDPELRDLCLTNHLIKRDKTNFYNLLVKEISNSDMTDPNAKIRLCPSSTNFNKLFFNVKKEVKNKDYLKYLWSSMKINPEPIILQILLSKEGWPTPNYFGACGRLIVEEYVGLPLSYFNEEPWIRRVKIASSLLDAAFKLTFKNENFAFYLTDISVDNIAINDQDEAIFIDLENIIIVDKNPPAEVVEKLKTWNETYNNDLDIDCHNCFAFSPVDLCKHKISDHNYYAICEHIFEQGLDNNIHLQGFLHDLPEYVIKKYPALTHLLKQCSKPNRYQSRIDIGIKLKQLLDKIIKHTK